jgi:hypothetical protein
MCLQKYSATIFVPKLSHFTEVVEIDVEPHDSENDVKYKLIKKLDIFKYRKGYLLSTQSAHMPGDWSKLITFEKIATSRKKYVVF